MKIYRNRIVLDILSGREPLSVDWARQDEKKIWVERLAQCIETHEFAKGNVWSYIDDITCAEISVEEAKNIMGESDGLILECCLEENNGKEE
jgi:hypothetical protein